MALDLLHLKKATGGKHAIGIRITMAEMGALGIRATGGGQPIGCHYLKSLNLKNVGGLSYD